MLTRFVVLISVLLLALPAACGPDKPALETGVIQSFQATNATILSQAKLEQFLTHLRGEIGPEMDLVCEAYTKIVSGFEIRWRGGKIEIDTQASGTGGGANYNAAVWDDIMQIQQRWERADDASKADARKWWFEVKDALARAATKSPAASQPSAEKATPHEE